MKILGKIKLIASIVVLILISIFCYNKYSLYDQFFDEEILKNLSDGLGRYTLSYLDKNLENDSEILNKSEFEKMKSWLETNMVLKEDEAKILNFGYSIKYLPEEEIYICCLHGPDRKESDLNYVVPENLKSQITDFEDIPSFSSFLFKSNDFDIILFGYKSDNIPRSRQFTSASSVYFLSCPNLLSFGL
ncbi:hypothetical protein LV716_06135 [Flagellimonas sp. HMM57]|uniref:hypothetical protein n=1 Tax=unclassified Flagellimonas TaxID=2644544 RepID=UPI0013D4617B|nr:MULTISPECIES: hypothetical protein [unclassified Flagellimonas]UII77348.1 hypothetical protein LV716_06135 [Flagellimonas sp. HMM57]